MTLPQEPLKCSLPHMRLAAWIMVGSILPVLTGCYFTKGAIATANQPTSHALYDRVDRVEKVVLKDERLLVFLEGRLTNSSAKGEFTLTVPLTDINIYQAVSVFPEYGTLKVSREAIHTGWTPATPPVDSYRTIPIGPPIQQDGYPDDYPWERPVIYAKSAIPLPGRTQTIYPLAQYRASGRLAMEFIYVDTAARRAYTVIYVDQVRVTKTKRNTYYCLLPLTVAADIATSPFQLIMAVLFISNPHM